MTRITPVVWRLLLLPVLHTTIAIRGGLAWQQRAVQAAASEHASDPARQGLSTEAEVRVFLRDHVDAWNRGDLQAFVDAYSDSPDLLFFSNGRSYRGRAEIARLMRERYKQGMGRLAFGEPHFGMASADTAVIWGEWSVQLPGAEERRGLGTAVLRKRDGRWQIAHDHSSFIMPARTQ